MQLQTPSRLAIVLTFFTGVGTCVSGLAQTGPTLFNRPSAAASAPQTPAPTASIPDDVASQSPAQRPAHRAEVTFTAGKLAIKAENSSLNQILREISRETGIKITGGVSDERVFGKYGPSPTSEVLAALLEGTSSNLLLLHSEAGSPGELILTPREGGVTPPNPNAPGFDDEGSGDDAAQPQVQQPAQQVPPPAAPSGYQGSAANGGVPPSQAPAATDATDPNAVKTPQQIYEQLQRLRQQQAPPQ